MRFLPLLLPLAACASVVPDTAARLDALDPLTADPAAIALRVALPPELDVVPGTARLTLEATGPGAEAAGVFVLSRTGDVFAVDARDHARLRTLQTRIAALEAADPDGTEGSLSLRVDPCRSSAVSGPRASAAIADTRASGAIPDSRASVAIPDSRTSVAIRIARDGPFLPLVEDGPVTAITGPVGLLPPCP